MAAFGRSDNDVDRIFAQDGPLAALYPGHYQRRGGQINLAQMVAKALKQRLTLMSEAETGTGKSFALLVPAVLWAVQAGWTVLVSTATIALQDQYVNKDLPLLKEVFASIGVNFRFAKAQGRSNYYCQDSKGNHDWEFASYNEQVEEWLMHTQTGDFNELPFEIKAPKLGKLYESLRADAEDCPGRKKCAFGESCYFYRARDAHEGAHVLVVNHALCALNDRCEGMILPPYHALMVDEAHQLEKYVRGAWEATLSAQRCFRLGGKLTKAGLDGQELLDQIGRDIARFFENYCDPFKGLPTIDWMPRKWDPGWEDWVEAQTEELKALEEDLCLQAGEIPKAGPIASAILELRRDLDRVTDTDQAARWFERDKKKRPILKISPVDVSEQMARLYESKPSVLTSATLAVGDSYAFAAAEMGVASPLEMPPLKSPFNWDTNCLYVFPKVGAIREEDLKGRKGETPRDTAARWASRIAGPIKAILERTSGRAFVLFTAKAAMEEAFDLVAPHCREQGWDVLLQGEYSKAETVARFKNGTSPVLFATASFWEGVDVPGSQLSCVIIDKLPFPSPANPIEKAKSEKFGFNGYNIPMVVRSLKQGVGRLIRSEWDRGIISILDPRVHKYANQIIKHLPGKALEALHRTEPANIREFLDGTGRRASHSELEGWAKCGLIKLSQNDQDRASEENGVGFNSADTVLGNELAQQLSHGLTDRQWALACSMLRKYHRQIGAPPQPSVEELLAAIEEEAA